MKRQISRHDQKWSEVSLAGSVSSECDCCDSGQGNHAPVIQRAELGRSVFLNVVEHVRVVAVFESRPVHFEAIGINARSKQTGDQQGWEDKCTSSASGRGARPADPVVEPPADYGESQQAKSVDELDMNVRPEREDRRQ